MTVAKSSKLPQLSDMLAKAKEKNNSASLRDTVCSLIVGARGDGKSTVLGTCTGTMLLICTSDEAHSISNAMTMAEKTYNATIVPFIIDIDEDENSLDCDQAIQRLKGMLDQMIAQDKVSDMFQWLGVDSVFSIFKKINEQRSIVALRAAKNQFRAMEAALSELLQINQRLVSLYHKGVNIAATCPGACEQDKTTGLYTQIEPLLEGYRNNLHVVGMFPDIAIVTRARFENEEGEETFKHIFQMGGTAEIGKTGKKVSGEQRTVNFRPRINGLLMEETPESLTADLTKFAKFKRNARIKRKKLNKAK